MRVRQTWGAGSAAQTNVMSNQRPDRRGLSRCGLAEAASNCAQIPPRLGREGRCRHRQTGNFTSLPLASRNVISASSLVTCSKTPASFETTSFGGPLGPYQIVTRQTRHHTPALWQLAILTSPNGVLRRNKTMPKVWDYVFRMLHPPWRSWCDYQGSLQCALHRHRHSHTRPSCPPPWRPSQW